ncbi:MAG: phosphotransferase [Candidatus Devosia phytovorans]|uniref:Phosphotransferase n=1 Tax=Candidatus Devosia phytovorans TaxID=3121372 RepID=A0AAJ6AXR3_9HYPH|nr:phosphotransferase [Devosia sp.]WEK02795.1 MAG: phosphotransferase [Devosia sp.]
MLKLYRDGAGKAAAFREAATLALLEDTGLPIPGVVAAGLYDGRWGVEMSRAARPAVAWDAPAIAALHIRIHQVRGKPLPALKSRLRRDIGNARQLDDALRSKLLSRLDTLAEGDALCHGDFHPGNIMGSAAAPVVVDWLDAATGPSEADACRSYLLFLHHAPALAEPYLDAYSTLAGRPRDTILAWLPIVAAARLAEGVHDEVARLLALAAG